MLESAHRGYAYQDLLVAARVIDLLLGSIDSATVDKKLHTRDRFDDVTMTLVGGIRERVQIKHRADRSALAPSSFTTEQRSLRFDSLLSSALADRAASSTEQLRYRIVLTDARPTDARLTKILAECEHDPGPFVLGMHSQRWQFSAQRIWPELPTSGVDDEEFAENFAFLRDGRYTRADVAWFCERLIVEVEASEASFDLTDPGAAELLLIDRVTRDIGAGIYPNADRSAIDVASALVRTVTAARAGEAQISVRELLRRSQLRHDFGAVARSYPVDESREVSRSTSIRDVITQAAIAADNQQVLLVVGPPGHGKSWACQRFHDALKADGWLVGEHYCYLGDADSQNESRAHTDRVIGSLLGRLVDADPRIVSAHLPRFAADDRSLVDAVKRARALAADRRVALLIDGLDHVTRTLGAISGRAGPSELLAKRLADLRLPPGSLIVIFSQPGVHLRSFIDRGAVTLDMPGVTRTELLALAKKWGIEESVLSPSQGSEDAAFLKALSHRSGGNVLYATYLCREVLSRSGMIVDAVGVLQSLPTFDGSLTNYYQHLVRGLNDIWIVDVLALLDFGVSRLELREMRPGLGNRIDQALVTLGPVLLEKAMQGGIRIYHESFARFWREKMADDPASEHARQNEIASWLQSKGLFQDSRAFRFLFSILSRVGRFTEVVALADLDFVVNAVAAGFHASAIQEALAIAADCAARIDDWSSVVQCVELTRSAGSYEGQRLEGALVAFADVAVSILGADVLAERLLFDGRRTVSVRAGLKICASIDAAGAAAPWREYLQAYEDETKNADRGNSGNDDGALAIAVLRGSLRAAVLKEVPADRKEAEKDELLLRLARYLETSAISVRAASAAIFDSVGMERAQKLLGLLSTRQAEFALALAEKLNATGNNGGGPSVADLALMAANCGSCEGEAHTLIRLGVPISAFEPTNITLAQSRLLELTVTVLEHDIQFHPEPLGQWLDACAVAAHRSPVALGAAEALLEGEGWYRCWLRFALALARAEATPSDQRPRSAADALKILGDDVRPFVGEPRACDLYRVTPFIHSTITRAIQLLDDAYWPDSIRRLSEVSDSISTTLEGEMSGPLARDKLLEIIVAHASAARHDSIANLVAQSLEENVGHAFYSDIALFHLVASRLSLAANNRRAAQVSWRMACRLFIAYGWRRDVTIYELLHALPVLIQVDRRRARECLQRVQPLCERVLYHTDGKDTRGVRSEWWELLSNADPLAASQMLAMKLFSACNIPVDEWEDAREELWRHHGASADPLISGALRLCLPCGLDELDPAALARLVAASEEDSCVDETLIRTIVARADERPTRYDVTNSGEIIGKDDRVVEQMNATLASAGIERILPSRVSLRGEVKKSADGALGVSLDDERLLAQELDDRFPTLFEEGLPGLAAAIKAWRGRPYDASGDQWDVNRFANAIGYRLAQCLQSKGIGDAELAIRSLADASRFDSRIELLIEVAEGLERAAFPEQSVLAYTLAWTHSRAHRGWFNFGGETNIDSLRKAARLDAALARRVIAAEVQRVIRSGEYSTMGVSQALIIALASANWPVVGTLEKNASIAFDAWNRAAEVIASRLPRVHPNDDVDHVYHPERGDEDERGAVEQALTLATFAGLGHPSKEQKRRSLLSIQTLLKCRPSLAAGALKISLAHLREPGTLSWLLSLCDQLPSSGAVASSEAELRELCRSEYLTVRTLARRLLLKLGCDPGELPVFDTIDEPSLSVRILQPNEVLDHSVDESQDEKARHITKARSRERAEALLDDVAGCRLSAADDLFPELKASAIRELSAILEMDEHQRRMKRQLESLSNRVNFRLPNALLAPYEAAEKVLQRVGGAGRIVRARAGEVISDPVEWEAKLAKVLLAAPHLSVALEATRAPRPALSAPPGYEETLWNEIVTNATTEEMREGFFLNTDGKIVFGTIGLEDRDRVPYLEAGILKGWRIIATQEFRWTAPVDATERSKPILVRKLAAIESRASLDRRGITAPPLGRGGVDVWFGGDRGSDVPTPLRGTGPLIQLDRDDRDDGLRALGYSCMPLTPMEELARLLRLSAGTWPFEMICERGKVGMVLRSWRSSYQTNRYELAWPTLEGNMILLRADLFDRLAGFVPTLCWRQYVTGILTD